MESTALIIRLPKLTQTMSFIRRKIYHKGNKSIISGFHCFGFLWKCTYVRQNSDQITQHLFSIPPKKNPISNRLPSLSVQKIFVFALKVPGHCLLKKLGCLFSVSFGCSNGLSVFSLSFSQGRYVLSAKDFSNNLFLSCQHFQLFKSIFTQRF